jgi:Fic family protein
MIFKIGTYVKQPTGYKAFIPTKFPSWSEFPLPPKTEKLHTEATLQLGKLDGITQILPDLDFFIFMYVRKEAALSSQIEGTTATMIDAIQAEAEITRNLPRDVADIQGYIKALNYGLKRLESFPLSLRFMREVHKELLGESKTDRHVLPGDFRTTQNWIGGASPQTARYVPPPIHEMNGALGDLEKFLNNDGLPSPLIKAALAHAQLETIHPFVDGNGRTGRLLITFYLCHHKMLDRPVLYLSEYFKKHRDVYFDLLDNYHNKGNIWPWLDFFLEGVKTVASEAIEVSRQVTRLRENDIIKIQQLGRSAENGAKVLQQLYKLPIINVKKIEEWTGLSRVNSNKLVKKLVTIKILEQQNKTAEYARVFQYKKYLALFS